MSLLVASRDERGMPSATRACGLTVADDRRTVTVFVPCETSADLVRDVNSTGAVAVVAVLPHTHEAYQLKGRALRTEDGDEAAQRIVTSYHERFTEELELVGLPSRVTRRLTVWPAVGITFEIDSVFEQTPGPRAGEVVGEGS